MLLGKPKPDDVEFISNPRYKEMLLKMQEQPRRSWAQVFPKASRETVEILDLLLQFSPDKRITATQALAHPYFVALHNPEYEPECKERFPYVTENLTVEAIWKELAAESMIPVNHSDN